MLQFAHRHIGTSVPADRDAMLKQIGVGSISELINKTVPDRIRLSKELNLSAPLTESEALAKLKSIAEKNVVNKSFIGMGYSETTVPPVILRNMLENPGWYTAYTPYQAEVSQGRLQSLLNFQTLVADLTGMDLSNASLLDESTAAAEAMTLTYGFANQKRKRFFVSQDALPQNIALLQTRGKGFGIEIVVGNADKVDFSGNDFCGAMIQYPDTYGRVKDYEAFVQRAHKNKTLVIAATDLMACSVLKPPGEVGVDIVVGSAQRFGVPMGFGGPHAGYMATKVEFARRISGRIIGVSIDSRGKPALRMAMQTREQHIRRDKATSNICTAQALLANMASAYCVYHGPEGIKAIANRIHAMSKATHEALRSAGYGVSSDPFFDTFTVNVGVKDTSAQAIQDKAALAGVNVRIVDDNTVGLSFGEAHTYADTLALLSAFGVGESELQSATENADLNITSQFARTSPFMTHPVFNTHHSETQMLRYLKLLEEKDLSLNRSMISLGSCTMKLNAVSEMMPVTWNEFCNMHPFAPRDQCDGYYEMIESLNKDLAEITGFTAASAQPNSGAQGEYAGLLCIRKYHESRGEGRRNVCLIPISAHGTNPASAVMSGMKVVVVKSDAKGNIDMDDLKRLADKHKDNLAAIMVTYPSTYGVFEEGIMDICKTVHDNGGMVYLDGANMTAMIGLSSPATVGANVCHLNLHKTFCIPHGGGGPGIGAIAVDDKLAPFLPGHPVVPVGGEGQDIVPKTDGAVSASPFGSPGILPISWMYIKMLGAKGLRSATEHAILNANYMSSRLDGPYKILFKGTHGYAAHEFIIDLRPFKPSGIVEKDVAKRLQDYGFHSPTMSWPVGGTLMVEPTESEDKAELDRFCDAMLSIRNEIADVAEGRVDLKDSPLTSAPHTFDMLYSDEWKRPYSVETAAFPAPWVKANKFWPSVGRIDDVHGDRVLMCSCPPMEDYTGDGDAQASVA